MPKAKPNFQKIAELAGVSASTVDRVLNGRGGVSDAKHQLVVAAARTLGTGRILPQAVRGPLHFDVIRTQDDHGTEYYQRLESALGRGAKMLKASVQLHRSIWPSADLSGLAKFISKPKHRRHGLLIITRDADEVRQAIQDVDLKKVPIVLLNSQMSDADAIPYVGIDNNSAGRTAALMLGSFVRQPGRVLLLTGSLTYTAHRQRAAGFGAILLRDFPHLTVEGPFDMNDDPDEACRIVRLRQNSPVPLVGIYNTGSGSAGVDKALFDLRSTATPFWIAHEATRQHAALMDRNRIHLLIDQDPQAQALCALQYLIHHHGEGEGPSRLQPVFHIVTRENLEQHRLEI